MSPDLKAVVSTLLAASEVTKLVSIDAIGDALGTLAVSTADIESIFAALEAKGRTIAAPAGQRGVANLRRVLEAARALKSELGRHATLDEIAARTGIDVVDVRHAVALGRVMGR